MTLDDAVRLAIVKLGLDPLAVCDFCWHGRQAHPNGGVCWITRTRFDGVREQCQCVQFEIKEAV